MEWLPPWLTFVGPPLAVAAAGLLWGMFHPRSRIMGPLWFRGEAGGPGDTGGNSRVGSGPSQGLGTGFGASGGRIALTFDDGPTPDSTAAVLDALKLVGAPATFFVIGRNVERYPELVRRMDAEGHLVANHSYDHNRQGLWGLNRFWRRQLDATDDAILELIGKRPAMFRPPMGLKHWHQMQEAQWSGHRVVTWNRRALDGRRWPRPAARRIVKRLSKAGDGDVLLLHDGHEPDRPRCRRATADAIVPLVNQLRDRGIEIVRLDELLRLPGYQEG